MPLAPAVIEWTNPDGEYRRRTFDHVTHHEHGGVTGLTATNGHPTRREVTLSPAVQFAVSWEEPTTENPESEGVPA